MFLMKWWVFDVHLAVCVCVCVLFKNKVPILGYLKDTCLTVVEKMDACPSLLCCSNPVVFSPLFSSVGFSTFSLSRSLLAWNNQEELRRG